MSREVYHAHCAAGTPMLCFSAHLHLGDLNQAHINVQISATLRNYLLKNPGWEGLEKTVRHCAAMMSEPVFGGAQRYTIDVPVEGLHLMRFNLGSSSKATKRQINRLANVFLQSIPHVLRDGTLPEISEPDISLGLYRQLTLWQLKDDGKSYLLVELQLPNDVDEQRFEPFAVQLMYQAGQQIAASHGLPTTFQVAERSNVLSYGQLFASGRAGNFDPREAKREIAKLVGQAWECVK